MVSPLTATPHMSYMSCPSTNGMQKFPSQAPRRAHKMVSQSYLVANGKIEGRLMLTGDGRGRHSTTVHSL